ncbi:MAG: pyruvate formate lyase family protein, partial [Armatimonadetes bacterium]|nr:pyruvate formate lyase family protein [Armatimonadota bacterium]
MELSPQINRLQQELADRLRRRKARIDSDPADIAAFGQALLRSYRTTAGQPAILRRAQALQEVAQSLPVRVAPHDLLAGHQTFTPPGAAPGFPREELSALGYATSTGHIVHDYEALVRLGVGGLRRKLHAQTPQSGEQRDTAQAFGLALDAFALFMRRHAEAADADPALAADLAHVADAPAATFRQGLQLVWLMQVFLHAENPTMAISFGRLDQVLWPLLQRDLEARELSRTEAFELVCAFCLKCHEGDESQNLVVGGVDTDGANADNLLSCLLLRTVRLLRATQPSLTVNWRADADPLFLQEAYDLAAAGFGQPGFINHEVVCRALQAAGLSPER